MIVGQCPRCGAPILMYTGAWHSVLPPPVMRTCKCFPSTVITTDRTS